MSFGRLVHPAVLELRDVCMCACKSVFCLSKLMSLSNNIMESTLFPIRSCAMLLQFEVRRKGYSSLIRLMSGSSFWVSWWHRNLIRKLRPSDHSNNSCLTFCLGCFLLHRTTWVSYESYGAVLPLMLFFYAVHDASTFWLCGWNSKTLPIQIMESYWAELSCGTIYYTVQGRASNTWVSR